MDDLRHASASFHHLSLVLALMLLTHTLLDRWQFATSTPTIDFFTFWSVPHSLSIKPVANIYDREGQEAMASVLIDEASSSEISPNQRRATALTSRLYNNRVEATGSPLLYTVVGWLSSGDYQTDQKSFATLSLLCLVLSVLLMCHLLQFSHLATTLTLIVLASAYAPLVTDLGVGNVNQIQLFIITLFIFFMARATRFAAGFALGVGIMLKPNISMIALLSLLLCVVDKDYKRQVRTFLGACAAAIVCFLISSNYFGGPVVWLEFAKSLPRTLTVSYPLENGNFGLAMLIARLTDRNASLFILSSLVAAFAYVTFRTRRRSRQGVHVRSDGDNAREQALHEGVAVAGIGCAIMLLSSKLAWLHYYVLLIPISLYLLRPAAEYDLRRPSARVTGKIVAAVAFFMLSTVTQTVTESLLRSQLLESVVLNAAAIAMVILGLREMRGYRGAWAEALPSPKSRSSAAMPPRQRHRLR